MAPHGHGSAAHAPRLVPLLLAVELALRGSVEAAASLRPPVVRLLGVAPEAAAAEANATVALALERLNTRLLCQGGAGNSSNGCEVELAFEWLPSNVDGATLSNTMRTGNFAAVFSGSRDGHMAQALALQAQVLGLPAFSYAPGLRRGAPYTYFFRTVADEATLPMVWLHFGSVVTTCLEFALIASAGSSITRSAFEDARALFLRSGITVPTIKEYATVAPRRSPGEGCGQELFWLLRGIRNAAIRFIIAAVDDEALLRCLLCAGASFKQRANESEQAHIWFTKGHLQLGWWDVDDPAIMDSVNPYASGRLAGKVGQLCSRGAVSAAARFHISAGPRFQNPVLNAAWRCGSQTLGGLRELSLAAGGPFKHGAGPAVDALCATALALRALSRNASTSSLFGGAAVDSSAVSQHLTSVLEDPSVLNFEGVLGQPVVFGSQSRSPQHFAIEVHQLQSDGTNLSTASWQMKFLVEWIRYPNGVVAPAPGSLLVEWPTGEAQAVCIPPRDPKSTVDATGGLLGVMEIKETNMVLLGVLIGVVCLVLIILLARIWLWWRRSSRDKRTVDEAIAFLKLAREKAEFLALENACLWTRETQGSNSGTPKASPSVHDGFGQNVQARIFCCIDSSAYEQDPDDVDGNLFVFSARLKGLVTESLRALCTEQRLDLDSTRICLCRSGEMRTGNLHSSSGTISGASFRHTDTTSPSTSGQLGSRLRWPPWPLSCCLRRVSLLQQQRRKDSMASVVSDVVSVVSRSVAAPHMAPERFCSMAFAVDQADFFIVVADTSVMLSTSATQALQDAMALSECWLHGAADPGRAFACLSALALKLPEERYIFDGMKLRLLLSSPGSGGKLSQGPLHVINGIQQFWPRFKEGLRMLGESSDATVRDAKVGLLQLWSAAVSHGDQDFVDLVRTRNAGMSSTAMGMWQAQAQDTGKDPLFNFEAPAPGIPSSVAVRRQLMYSDAPLYFPVPVPEAASAWLTPAAFERQPPPQELHGSHDRVALLRHRRAVVSLARALSIDFSAPLVFAPGVGFEAPSVHPRARVVSKALKYFDKQLQLHGPAGEPVPAPTSPTTSSLKRHRSNIFQRGATMSRKPTTITTSRSSFLSPDNWIPPEVHLAGGGGSPERTPSFWEHQFCGKTLEQDEASKSPTSGVRSSYGRIRDVVFPGQTVVTVIGHSLAKCAPGHRQCAECLAARRRAEAILAIQALVPVVCAYLLAFLRAVHASEELRALVLREISREMEMGYRAVYHAVLGLIREEPAYGPLMQAVDKAIAVEARKAACATANSSGSVELVLAAHARHRRLQEYCSVVARRVSGCEDDTNPADEPEARGGLDLDKVPPPKGCWRILEKSALRPGLYRARARGSGTDVSHIGGFTGPVSTEYTLDAARSTILLNTCQGMLHAVEMITCEDSPVQIVRGKNRLKTPTLGGWADIMLNVIWKDDPMRHVMEIQLIHVKLMMIRKSDAFKGHDRYASFRAAMEIAEVFDLDPSRPAT